MLRTPTAIRVEYADAVATVTLARPRVLNAVDGRMRRELRTAFDSLKEDTSVRAVVVTGEGRGFCAGADLRDQREGHDPERTLVEEYNPLIRAMRGFPRPVVTAVNGVAAGAGMSIALAGDIVVAAETARFVPAFGQIALVPDSGLTRVLVRALGRHRAAAHLFIGEPMTASDALDLGLVYRVVRTRELDATVQQLARDLASGPTYAFELTKRLLNEAEDAALNESMAGEAALQRLAWTSDDHREGVAAFLGKNPPNFTGR